MKLVTQECDTSIVKEGLVKIILGGHRYALTVKRRALSLKNYDISRKGSCNLINTD